MTGKGYHRTNPCSFKKFRECTHLLIQVALTKMKLLFFSFTAEETVGFLAHLSCGLCDVPSDGPLVFDRTRYNYGSHYSTRTGKFTAPVTALYLITSHLRGTKNRADYSLMVDGVDVTYTSDKNAQDSDGHVIGHTNIVLKLNVGQQFWIDPKFSGSDTVAGIYANSHPPIYSWFGAHLLKTVS